MNYKQLARCTKRGGRNYQIVADIIHPQGCKVAIKMGGRKVSHRRVKAAMKAAKSAWPEASVFFRHGGTLVTTEIADEWQKHTAANGYWWPAMAKWAKRAAKTASRINEDVAEV